MAQRLREVDKLLRLPNFKFTNESILGRKHKRAALALGALVKGHSNTARLGNRLLITKKLITLFETAMEIRKRYPSLEISERFWELVMEELSWVDEDMYGRLELSSLSHIVETYQDAYHRGRADLLAGATGAITIQGLGDADNEDDGEDEDDDMTGEDQAQKKVQTPENRRARLLAIVGEWYDSTKTSLYTPDETDLQGPLELVKPTQQPGESSEDFTLRLGQAYDQLVNAYKTLASANQKKVTKIEQLVDAQRLSDEKKMTHQAILEASNDKLEDLNEKLRAKNSELKRYNSELGPLVDKLNGEVADANKKYKEANAKYEGIEREFEDELDQDWEGKYNTALTLLLEERGL